MTILHYLIGVPNYRHGGAPTYAFDLLQEQSKFPGTNVAIITPGNTLNIGMHTKIKSNSSYKEISCYEIKNPEFIPLLYGVKSADYILKNRKTFSKTNLQKFYDDLKPDVIHVHTLMGLPMNLITFMKSKGVKLVITSHDYYGICPRVNIVDRYGNACQNISGKLCKDCNYIAKRKWILTLLNSKIFLRYKKYIPHKIAQLKYRQCISSETRRLMASENSSFVELHKYYKKMYELFDAIHFNSEVSKNVFEQHIMMPYNEIIPITTNAISDRRKLKTFGKNVRLSFVAGLGSAKGFPLLKKVLMKLKGFNNWQLNVWYGGEIGSDPECGQIVYRGTYTTDQLPDIYSETDLLVVPSIWQETFSLVTLEALSFGVPVLMSDNVGAQILIKDIAPDYIYHGEDGLMTKLKEIFDNPKVLGNYNLKVYTSETINFSEKKHALNIIDFYHRVIKL